MQASQELEFLLPPWRSLATAASYRSSKLDRRVGLWPSIIRPQRNALSDSGVTLSVRHFAPFRATLIAFNSPLSTNRRTVLWPTFSKPAIWPMLSRLLRVDLVIFFPRGTSPNAVPTWATAQGQDVARHTRSSSGVASAWMPVNVTP